MAKATLIPPPPPAGVTLELSLNEAIMMTWLLGHVVMGDPKKSNRAYFDDIYSGLEASLGHYYTKVKEEIGEHVDYSRQGVIMFEPTFKL